MKRVTVSLLIFCLFGVSDIIAKETNPCKQKNLITRKLKKQVRDPRTGKKVPREWYCDDTPKHRVGSDLENQGKKK